MTSNPKCRGGKYIQLGPKIENDKCVAIFHNEDHSLSMGIAKEAKEGQSLQQGSVLATCTDDPNIYEVVEIESKSQGPVMVNSNVYRENHARIFGTKSKLDVN